MDRIKFNNYRCFRSEQSVRLAPLTLLVGENSTGKTSFMALIRALWDVGFAQRVPDFKEEPYELGSFDEVAHYRGPSESRTASFSAAFEYCREPRDERHAYRFCVEFRKHGTAPYPFHRRYAQGRASVEESVLDDGYAQVRVGTENGSWRLIERGNTVPVDFNQSSLRSLCYDVVPMGATAGEHVLTTAEPMDDSPAMSQDDWAAIERFLMTSRTDGLGMNSPRPFASAPVRSRPRRTYEPSRQMRDPEGSDVPMDLAEIHSGDRKTWDRLKGLLEHFGQKAGLFDEIAIKRLGRGDASPFQMQVRRFGGRLKGPRRNLYGVMEEVVDRFDVDGLELTFREGLYFPAPRGDRSIGRARQPLMTGLIERVRALLDRRGADRGRRLQLGVRVPQTVAECHDVGLDVPAWIAAGLVDYVAPMDSMYSDFNPAYEEFSSLTAASPCGFYPGVLPYCSHRDRSGSALSLDNYRALVHTLRRQGADGISIYNYQMHWDGFRSTGRDNGSETMYPTALAHLRELADLERVGRGPRHYLFHSMWGDLDAYLPRGTSSAGARRDSAVLLQRGAEGASGSYRFRLYEDIAAAGHARLHFRVAGLTPADPLAVALNDVPITVPRLRRIWHPDGRAAPYGRPLPAYTSCMFDLEPGSTVIGDNRLAVSVPAGPQAELLIDEVEVTVIPA